MTPLIFISARSTDYQYAEEIYRFLKSHGLRMFFSQESLPELASSDYRKQIDDALDSAQHMIVVTSSKANVTSSWVEAEWGLFINEKRSGRKVGNLITVVAGGLGPSDLPASLRYYEVIPFQRDAFQKILRYVAPGLNEPISTVPPGQTAEEESRPPNAGPSAVIAGSANPAANNQRVTQASGDSGVTAVTPIVANAESTARDSVTSPGPSPVHGQSAEAKPSSEPHKRRTEPPAPSSPIESTSAGKAAWIDVLREETRAMVFDEYSAWHIDLIGSGSEEHTYLWMKYYADEKTRRQWMKDWPDYDMPDHEDPPYDRDRHLPGAGF